MKIFNIINVLPYLSNLTDHFGKFARDITALKDRVVVLTAAIDENAHAHV